ncbi:MAG TPA: hypothetical protein VNP98_16075 [Chthoniobacterales bacterium]|nr:hypothetical protein [Chthoniobacterales bacterium]
MKHKLLLLGGVWSVLLLSASDGAAEGPTFALDVEAQGKKITLTVPPSRQVEFSLIQSKAPTPVDFHLLPFIGEEGNSVAIKLVIPGFSENPQSEHAGVKIEKSVFRLRLVEVNLPTAGKYTGSLIVAPRGGESKSWPIELTRAANYQPAVLVLDRQSLTADVTQPFWGWSSGRNPEFTVRVRDKTGQWDLKGVTARLEQVAKAPGEGFDLGRNVDFKFNGQNADLTASPAKPMGRTVAAGRQATIGVVFQDLQAGEYNGTLRFTAVNSSADDAQKLAFVLRVRHSIWWAVLVLLLALGVSFVTTKVITLLRNRYALVKKINDVDHDWLRAEPPVLPVVWVRSVLLQSKERSSRLWLSGLDVIDERVNKAAQVVELLDGVRKLRDAVEALPELMRKRAQGALERTICALDPRALDEQKATEFKIKLAELRGWFDEGKRDNLYWADLSFCIKHLLEDVRIPDIRPAEYQPVLQKLVDRVAKAIKDVPAELQEKMEVERDYARLKILWGRHRTDDFKELVEFQKKNPHEPLQDLFNLADDLAWEQLKVRCEDNRAHIRAPASQGPEPLQAFRPLVFEFTTGDPSLDRTYLVERGLKYCWSFKRGEGTSTATSEGPKVIETPVPGSQPSDVVETPASQTKKPKVLGRSAARSAGPNIVEYAEGKGTLKVTVEITRRDDDTKKVDLEPGLPIVESKDFAWKEGLERVEVISFILAGIVAIITGLSTIYFKNPSFGSVQDYVSLFLWGAAVDQTKNALQLLQSYSATPAK